MSRRAFVKNAGAAAVTAAIAPMIVPAKVLGLNGQPGANDRIVLGLIGVGGQCPNLGRLGQRGRALRNMFNNLENVTVAVSADPMKDRADVQDYREILDRKDIDGVIIATPDHWHSLIAIHAAQAGKHIYTEKPLTYKISEGRTMVEFSRYYKVVHQTGSQQRSDFNNYRGCMLIRNGALGKIHKVEASNYPSPLVLALPGQALPAGLDWEKWCGPAPLVPYHHDIFHSRARPGWMSFSHFTSGEPGNWGGHGLDQIQWALGMDESGPVEIWSEGGPFEPRVVTEPNVEPATGPDQPKVFMRFDDGSPDGIVMEFVNGAPRGGGKFFGENGTLTIDRSSVQSDPEELQDFARRPAELEKLPVQLTRSTNHYQNWIDCIKTGERPCADVETGHRAATLGHLLNIARWTGKRLSWDPQLERFTNDEEANKYLDYDRRAGYELPKLPV